MQNELSNFGDHAVATLQANASIPEGMGVDGYYKVECRDANGNLKWNEEFPNLVVAIGKQLMLDTLLRTSGTYTTVGPFLGLINNSTTFAAADTMTSKTWTELTTYTVGVLVCVVQQYLLHPLRLVRLHQTSLRQRLRLSPTQ
jgi:hypothetical protein